MHESFLHTSSAACNEAATMAVAQICSAADDHVPLTDAHRASIAAAVEATALQVPVCRTRAGQLALPWLAV